MEAPEGLAAARTTAEAGESRARQESGMNRPTHGTLGDLSDDLSACPACLDGEPHAHRSARSARPDSRIVAKDGPSSGRTRWQSSIAGQSGIYGPATWNEHPTHRPESWPRAIVAALVGLLAVALWCAAIYLVAS